MRIKLNRGGDTFTSTSACLSLSLSVCLSICVSFSPPLSLYIEIDTNVCIEGRGFVGSVIIQRGIGKLSECMFQVVPWSRDHASF